MTQEHVNNGLRAGLTAGLVLVFLIMTGFTATWSQLLANLAASAVDLSESQANFAAFIGTLLAPIAVLLAILGVRIILILVGLWAGSRGAQPTRNDTWAGVLVSSLISSIILTIFLGIFTTIVVQQIEAGVNLRKYLVALSPDAVQLLLLGADNVGSAILNQALWFFGSCLLGAVLAMVLGRGRLKAIRSRIGATLGDPNLGGSGVANVRQNPMTRYALYILLLAFLFWLPTQLPQSWDYNMGTIAIYVLLGLGLNIVVGLAGLLDLGYVAFFAVGAYTVALLTGPDPHGIEANFWLVLPLAVLLAGTAGVLLGVPVLRLRGDYLAIVTLGFGEIIRILAGSDALTGFTGGPEGVVGVPFPKIPEFFGLTDAERFYCLLILAVVLIIFITNRLQHSRIGRAWVAIREDETVAQAMGINTLTYKLLAFGIGAAFAGLGGAMFAARNQFTNPQDHGLLVSINVLAVVIVGGMGSIPGVILGAFVLKGIPEILRELESYRIIIFGALLVTMMILRPEGIWPSQRRRLEIHDIDEEVPKAEPPLTEGGVAIT